MSSFTSRSFSRCKVHAIVIWYRAERDACCRAFLTDWKSGTFGHVTYHPESERKCDEVLNEPLLKTPPPEPEVPPQPRVRRPRQFKFPPKFPLLSDEFYLVWCNHKKQVIMAEHRVDDSPPTLFPELYLQPRRLDIYAKIIEGNMKVNQDLLKRINLIQRNGGYIDCYNETNVAKINELMCQQRQRILDEIAKSNYYIYHRLCKAKSEQPGLKELNEMWQDTKHKLILGAQLPFILFKQQSMHGTYTDPAFEKGSTNRTMVTMDVVVRGGSKIGNVHMELFNDIAPQASKLFLSLIKGDYRGYAYTGTRIFRSVPELYCRGGDVVNDNGFGQYMPEDATEPMTPEEFILNHTVPGVLSMAVTKNNELTGQFNIVFKPLPQFDGKHVVFGRIKTGPAQFLERISALGRKLGPTSCDVIIRKCGYYSRSGQYHEGAPNTIKFPTRPGSKKD